MSWVSKVCVLCFISRVVEGVHVRSLQNPSAGNLCQIEDAGALQECLLVMSHSLRLMNFNGSNDAGSEDSTLFHDIST